VHPRDDARLEPPPPFPMKIARLLILAALLAPCLRADSAPASSSEGLANRLLVSTGASTLIAQNFEAGLVPFLDRMKAQGMPDDLVERIHGESRHFFDETYKWDDVRPLLVKLYTDSFTEAELRDLVAFYDSPTGKKAAMQMPALLQKGMVLGMGRIQQKMPEYQKRVAAIIDEYRKKSAPAQPAPAAAASTPAQGKQP